MKKNLLFSIFLFLSLTSANNLLATTITALAEGSTTPGTAIWADTLNNGDFTISGTPLAPVIGDGADEFTTWTFDFTADSNYYELFALETLTSAWLELSLTPSNTLISTDSVRIDGLSGITTEIQSLPTGSLVNVNIDLMSYYSSDQIMGSFSTLGGIGMFYEDDSIVSQAALTLTTAPVPEPATLLLFGVGLTGLAAFSRKKKK